jgi:hypothetical protein
MAPPQPRERACTYHPQLQEFLAASFSCAYGIEMLLDSPQCFINLRIFLFQARRHVSKGFEPLQVII